MPFDKKDVTPTATKTTTNNLMTIGFNQLCGKFEVSISSLASFKAPAPNNTQYKSNPQQMKSNIAARLFWGLCQELKSGDGEPSKLRPNSQNKIHGTKMLIR